MKKILIVDDEPELLKGVETYLRINGNHVWTAKNGSEALLKVSNQEFDIIITDIMMPKLDGVEFIKRIQVKKEMSPTIIVMSAHIDREIFDKIKHRVSKIFIKPFDLLELFEFIKTL